MCVCSTSDSAPRSILPEGGPGTSWRVALRVDDPQTSKAMLLEAIDGRGGPATDVVALNAGAALYAAGIAVSIQDGLARARAEMAKGTPRAKLDQFVALTNAKAGAGA